MYGVVNLGLIMIMTDFMWQRCWNNLPFVWKRPKQDCNMQGWMEHATSHIGNTSKWTHINSSFQSFEMMKYSKKSIIDTYTEDTSLASLGVCCGLRRIRISGRGETEKSRRSAGKGNMRIMREPPILCESTHWLTMWKPKAWLTSLNYDGWYQQQLEGGIATHFHYKSSI